MFIIIQDNPLNFLNKMDVSNQPKF